jgi:threonine dehydratase
MKQESDTSLPVTLADIEQAQKRLQDVARRTPVLTSAAADAQAGAQLFFKCENFQRIGAFKFRGAYNAIAQFTKEQLAGGVISFSSGNHAQAIALAARLAGTKAVIVMPSDAPQIKVEATRNYGAEIVFYDRYKDDREAISRKLAQERGLTLIPPYDHAQVIAGQGTVAKELFDEVENLDVLVVPIGGGGLLSGCAIAAKTINPTCTVIGVEPEAGNDAQQSFRSRKIVRIDTPQTIADGAQTQQLGSMTFPIICTLVDDIVTVSDTEIVSAMTFFASRMKIIAEPTGCLAAAAVFSRKLKVAGKKAGIVVSGGNIDLARFAALIQK